MPLSSANTLAQVRDTFIDSVGYERVGSVTMAWNLVEASTILIGMAKRAKSNGEEFEFDHEYLSAVKDEAKSWARANATATAKTGPGSVRYMDLREFRG